MKIEEIEKKQIVADAPKLTVTFPEAPIEEALKVMVNFKIHHLLVFNGEEFVGIISDRDILSYVIGEDRLKTLTSVRVSEVMRRDVPTIKESTTVADGLSLMIETNASALPIFKNGRAKGIVTESNMLRAFDRLLHKDHPIKSVVAKGETFVTQPFAQGLINLLSEIGI